MTVLRKIARIIAVLIAVCLIVGCGISFFATDGNAETFTVMNNDYEPMIVKGSLVEVKPVAMTEIAEGDLFVYIDPADESRERVFFRVTEVDTDSRDVSGVNEQDGSEVTYSYGYLEGKVVTNRAGWGYFYDFFGNMIKLIICMIIAIILFLFSVEPQRPGYEREKREKARAKAHR